MLPIKQLYKLIVQVQEAPDIESKQEVNKQSNRQQKAKLNNQISFIKLNKLQMDFQTMRDGQNSTNAVNHVNLVEGLVRESDKDLQQYHKLVQLFRQDLQSLKTKVMNDNEQIKDTTTPLIEALYRQLEMGMLNQKEENNTFQDQLTDLKKQKSVLSQMINASFKRAEELNQEVGHY